MELVAARPGHHAGRGAAGPAVLGRRALGQDPELGNRLDRQLERVAPIHPVQVLRPVDEIHVLLGPHAVDGIGLALPQAPAGRGDARGQRRDTRLQQPQLREVATVERQIDQLAAGDDTPQCVGGGVDQLSAAGDGHRLGDRPQLQLRVDADALAHADDDRLEQQRRELWRTDFDAVLADRQQEQPVEAIGGRLGLFREAGLEVPDHDPRPGDRARGLVGDRPFNRAGRILGRRRRRSGAAPATRQATAASRSRRGDSGVRDGHSLPSPCAAPSGRRPSGRPG